MQTPLIDAIVSKEVDSAIERFVKKLLTYSDPIDAYVFFTGSAYITTEYLELIIEETKNGY